MDFVWIYAKQFSSFHRFGMFNELEYSIKTVQKFYKGARCWVVGDEPPKSVEANHIPTGLVQTGKSGLHRENLDIQIKFREIIKSDIDEEFVLMYDDQFFLRPIEYDDFKPTAMCRIESIESYFNVKRIFGMLYGHLWTSTYKTIFEMTTAVYDWETHLPRLMEKKKTEFVLDVYDPAHNNLMIHPLYYTLYSKNPILLEEDDTIRSHVWTIGSNIDYNEIFSRKFLILDDNSIVPEMFSRLDSLL